MVTQFWRQGAVAYLAYSKGYIFPLCKHRHGTGTRKWDMGEEGDNKTVNDKLVKKKGQTCPKMPEGMYFQASRFFIFKMRRLNYVSV